jgi:ABC-type nitrate/sulfonate/bicarbonate transport system substrate-binding protein
LKNSIKPALSRDSTKSEPRRSGEATLIPEIKDGDGMGKDIIKIVGFEKDITLSVAETKGFFGAQNLEITFDQTPNSTTEISGLLTGKWDVAFDNGDNVVAWDEGQGADGKVHDLFIFMGGSRELNQGLFVSSGINEISALKDKILGVDASTTGFAVVLRYILQRNNLLFERDYSFKPVGSSRMRLAELVAGNIAGAMLNPRYVEASTLRQLAAGKDYADPYPARVGLTTRKWARSHGSLLVRFIGAILQAVNWILESKNKRQTIEIINTRMGRSPEQADEDYHRLLDPSAGLTDRCAFDPHSLSTVLEMRRRLGMIESPLPSLDKYYDDSFYREAVSLSR